MKKLFFSLIAWAFYLAEAKAQIILANPNVTQRVDAVKETEKKTVAFRLAPFTTYLSLPANEPSEIGTVLNVSVKEFDLGNNTSGGSFNVPENGVYHLEARLNVTYPITDYENYLRFFLMLNKNGSVMEKTILMNPATDKTPFHTLMICTTQMLMKGDVITASYNADANTGVADATGLKASFSGFKINSMGGDAATTPVIR